MIGSVLILFVAKEQIKVCVLGYPENCSLLVPSQTLTDPYQPTVAINFSFCGISQNSKSPRKLRGHIISIAGFVEEGNRFDLFGMLVTCSLNNLEQEGICRL
jgi:hypothetical protein